MTRIEMKNLQTLMEQKKNNKGSALIMTIVSVALLSLMVAVLLTISFYNFRMKTTDLKAKQTFYTAETAMDEIRIGLQNDVSTAFSAAYIKSLQNYSSTDETKRNQEFEKVYLDRLEDILATSPVDHSSGHNYYELSYLEGFLYKTAFNGKTGAKLTDDVVVGQDNQLVRETKDGTNRLVLKNVTVTYYDEQNYLSQIKTDIVLECPTVNLDQSASSRDYLKYCLIANEQLVMNSVNTVGFVGSVYAGKEGVELNAANNVTFEQNPSNTTSIDMFITNNTVNGDSSEVIFNGMEIWAKNLVLNNGSLTVKGNSTTYISNDIVLNSNSNMLGTKLTMAGKYYGYGNLDSAKSAVSISEEAVEDEPSEYSSAILINGVNSSVDLTGLSEMLIAGNAYVMGSEKNEALSRSAIEDVSASAADTDWTKDQSNENIGIGEAISIKRNQTAYIVPAECVAPDSKNYGGQNPMTAKRYQQLREELGIKDNKDSTKGLIVTGETVTAYGKTLDELGVKGCKVVCYPVRSLGSMVYLFMDFKTDKDATNFFATYYNMPDQKNVNKLRGTLDLYTGTDGIKLPENVDDNTATGANTFFYNGGVVVSEGAVAADGSPTNFYVRKNMEGIADGSALATWQKNQSRWQDMFASLGTNLTKNYSKLGTAEGKDVYTNLIQPMTGNAVEKMNIPAGKTRVFMKESGGEKYGAIVKNGDFELSGSAVSGGSVDVSGEDTTGTAQSVPMDRVRVIIASGDVTVDRSFTGLIVAGGKVTVSSNVTLTANEDEVDIALSIMDGNNIGPSSYIVNSGNLLMMSGSGKDDESDKDVSIADLVYYANWKKQ